VHVGGGASDLAQARSLERVLRRFQSVKLKPLWQFTHRALPVNSLNPAISFFESPASSPAIQRSKRVSGEKKVRS